MLEFKLNQAEIVIQGGATPLHLCIWNKIPPVGGNSYPTGAKPKSNVHEFL
jgi:hypothetical protein